MAISTLSRKEQHTMTSQYFFTSTASGTPIQAFSVKKVPAPKPVAAKSPAHLITIIDRSGSMYGVMHETREMVAKLLTVAEYQNEDLKVTVISYSSQGDCQVHAARTPIIEFMQPGSAALESVRRIEATALTCASQALQEACKHIAKGELTGIVLHTDGWFNDRSPTEEKKVIDHIIQHALWGNPEVFINTVGYGYADRALLDSIASRMSGRFVMASTVKEVYNAIFDTTKVLVGRTLPALPVSTEGCEWLAAHNMGQKKVNGGTTDFTLRGLGENDPVDIYRFTQVPLSQAQAELSGGAEYSHRGALILSRIALAQGDLRTAKAALLGSKYSPLLADGHHRAMSVTALGAFAVALEEALALPDLGAWTASLGLGMSDALPFTDLVNALNDERASIEIHVDSLLGKNAPPYRRRGLKRVPGTWDGTQFKPAAHRLAPRWEDAAGFVPYSGISFSSTTASASLLVSVDADLVDNATDQKIARVAGIKLDLRQHRNYTLISDGEVNLERLPIHVTNPGAFGRLKARGVFGAAATFTPGEVHLIDLKNRPLVADETPGAGISDNESDLPVTDILDNYTRLSIHKSWAAGLSGETVALPTMEVTPEQAEALLAHSITTGLNFSPSTTTPYVNRDEAVRSGEIDSYTRYEVTFGLVTVAVSSEEFNSGNELLNRFYQKAGDPKAKITLAELAAKAIEIEPRTLSARTKITAVDNFQKPIFDQEIANLMQGGQPPSVSDLQRMRDAYLNEIRPLVFEAGCTGVAPASFGPFLTGDAFTQKYPDCKVPKKAKEEGLFYVKGRVVMTITPRTEWYTTPKGEEVARSLTKHVEEV
jgi:hypothetical protein